MWRWLLGADQPLPAGLRDQLRQLERHRLFAEVVLAGGDIDAPQEVQIDLVILAMADPLEEDPLLLEFHLRFRHLLQRDGQVEPVRLLAPLHMGNLWLRGDLQKQS